MVDTQLSTPPHPTPPRPEEERFYKLRLIRSRKVGPQTYHRLMAQFGSAKAAFAALPHIARNAGVSDYLPCPEAQIDAEFRRAKSVGAIAVFHGETDYPTEFLNIADAPPVLWLRGRKSMLLAPKVAVVGARNASALGLRMATRLAQSLGEAGYVVVSGLARGIDGAAHKAALDHGTIAVQAGGVDVIYPDEHRKLGEAIGEQGLLISEQPLDLSPQAGHFPQRNRLISGLALGIVVIEAGARSGSLMTARLGLEQGREVMAVPGHPFDARAAGCNILLRDGAILVRDAADVIEAVQSLRLGMTTDASRSRHAGEETGLGAQARDAALKTRAVSGDAGPNTAGAPPRPAARPLPGREGVLAAASKLHQLILDRLGPNALPEDQLVRDLSLPPSKILPELLKLEVSGHIKRQAGGLLSQPMRDKT